MPDDDVKVLFGRRVRQLRTERGVSQEAFAHAVGIDRSYYGSIERGLRNVSLVNIAAIAEALGVPPAELLRFEALADTTPPGDAPAKRSPPRPQTGRPGRRGRG